VNRVEVLVDRLTHLGAHRQADPGEHVLGVEVRQRTTVLGRLTHGSAAVPQLAAEKRRP